MGKVDPTFGMSGGEGLRKKSCICEDTGGLEAG